MKNILLYFFLFTYALVVFKPYAPYFSDAIAHVLFFKEHIATVHAHQGKYHVHAEVNQLAKNQSSEKNTPNKKISFENDHIFMERFQLLSPQNNINRAIAAPISFSNQFATINLPPPKI